MAVVPPSFLSRRGAAVQLLPQRVVKMSARISLGIVLVLAAVVSARAADNTPPPGFVALFNGKDLTGWKGLLKEPLDNPARRAKLTPEEAGEAQKEADEVMRKGGGSRKAC